MVYERVYPMRELQREEFVVALCRERRVPSSNLSNVEEEFK
jgi:hypothetical protein